MQAIDINKKLIDGYLELLDNLSAGSKLDLISKLSASLKTDKKKPVTLKSLKGDFIPEKSADELVNDLKEARKFTRTTERF